MGRSRADDDLAYVRTGVGEGLDTMLVHSLLRTHSYLSPFIDAGLRRQNLTSAQLNVLLALRSAGPEGLRMGQIGDSLVVTRSNVTGLIDRLERQGLVARTAHRDRRATIVRLTGAGEALLARTTPGHAEALAELTTCFTNDQKQTLIRLLSKLRRELRHRRGGAS